MNIGKNKNDKIVTRGILKAELRAELSKFATKDGLKTELSNYPTKDDLKIELSKYATKDDLKTELSNYPTKDDLKSELSKYATKDDLLAAISGSEKRVIHQFGIFQENILSEFYKALEPIAKATKQMMRIQEHETRIESLEHDVFVIKHILREESTKNRKE